MMQKKQFFLNTALGVLMSASAAASFPVFADQSPYVTDAQGNPVVSDIGGCVHTDSWKKSMPLCPEPTVVVEEQKAKIVFALADAEFFGFDKATISGQAKADLDLVVNAVDDSELIHGITVTGHADHIGPPPFNAKLAMKRAEAVKAYLISKGIPADRIQAMSDGDSQPLVVCPNIKNENKLIRCLAPNRRVDVEALLADDVNIDSINLVPVGDK